jgi:hypothetical protein
MKPIYINSENGTGITKPKWFANTIQISLVYQSHIYSAKYTHIRELNSLINVCYRQDDYSKE